ncbi:MAG: hypothetical protein QOD00_2916 [Blastocatellia bacterium]|jgi:hypothetical protein|nr:hypothetical protein [Blastocatellia bacterium]
MKSRFPKTMGFDTTMSGPFILSIDGFKSRQHNA